MILVLLLSIKTKSMAVFSNQMGQNWLNTSGARSILTIRGSRILYPFSSLTRTTHWRYLIRRNRGYLKSRWSYWIFWDAIVRVTIDINIFICSNTSKVTSWSCILIGKYKTNSKKNILFPLFMVIIINSIRLVLISVWKEGIQWPKKRKIV